MLELSDPKLLPAHLRGGVVCIGNFDGVHAGHAQMLSTARDLAALRHKPFHIMTFDPHPARILDLPTAPKPLTTLTQRKALLAAFAPDALIVIHTNKEFLAITAETFLSDIMRGAMGAEWMVEGSNFTFGRGAKGTVEMLHKVGPEMGLGVTVVPTVERSLQDCTLVKVSSSLIRWLVEQGRVGDAERCLGRPYTLCGEVVKGLQRGRTIGFPTANVATEQILPAAGVYAGACRVGGELYGAAISIGTNPTFAGQSVTVEAYLLDFQGDVYGQRVGLEFWRWLRDVDSFAGVGALTKQLARDVAETREIWESIGLAFRGS